jgi:hypothetical protein
MGKLSRNMRITILVEAIAFFVFAYLYLVPTNVYLETMSWPYNDPYYPKAFGISLLVLGAFLTISFFRNEWIQAKLMIEIVIMWSSLILVANFIEITILPLPVGVIVTTWNNNIILLVLIIVSLFFFLKEMKRGTLAN